MNLNLSAEGEASDYEAEAEEMVSFFTFSFKRSRILNIKVLTFYD